MVLSRTRHDLVARAAERSARISACAVGSWRSSRSLRPAPMTSPSRTTTAPTGTSSCSRQRPASLSASAMNPSSCLRKPEGTGLSWRNLGKPGGVLSPVRRVLLLSLTVLAALVPAARAAEYVPDEVVVHDDRGTRVVATPADHSVLYTAGRLRDRASVDWAVPNYIAHAAQAPAFVPNDPGNGGGWQAMQWNFLPGTGVNAPG